MGDDGNTLRERIRRRAVESGLHVWRCLAESVTEPIGAQWTFEFVETVDTEKCCTNSAANCCFADCTPTKTLLRADCDTDALTDDASRRRTDCASCNCRETGGCGTFTQHCTERTAHRSRGVDSHDKSHNQDEEL